MHSCPQHQAGHVKKQMPLAPADLLGPVIAPDAPDCGGFDRLAVDDAGARLLVSPLPDPVSLLAGGARPRSPDGAAPAGFTRCCGQSGRRGTGQRRMEQSSLPLSV
jgi:hypothetical protein